MRIQIPSLHAATRVAVAAGLTLSALAAPSAAAGPAVHWRELADPSRSSHSMVWDSRRGRAIVLGGDYSFGMTGTGVWELVRDANPHWRMLPTLGNGPLPRSGMSAVYDSLRDRLLVFGGRNGYPGDVTNDLWALSLASTLEWSKLDVGAGASPGARFDASLVLDSHDRLVLFGGDFAAATDSGAWVLPLSAEPLHWREIALPGLGPGPRARHAAAYCPTTDRITIFGGENDFVVQRRFLNPLRPASTWELVLAEPPHWEQRSTAPLDSCPLPERGGVLVADRAGESATLISGEQDRTQHDPSLWRIDLIHSTWARVPTSGAGPGIRAGAAACLVPASGEVLIHGGGQTVVNSLVHEHSALGWSLSAGSPPVWSALTAHPRNVPSPTRDPRLHLDAETHRLITWNSRGVWTLDFLASNGWQIAPGSATQAPLIEDAVSLIDPVRRRLLVFGGRPELSQIADSQKLWSWPLDGTSGWQASPIHGLSEPVWGMQCAYDAKRDRAIVIPSFPTTYSDAGIDMLVTLELASNPPAWVRVPTQGTLPAVRSDAAVALDEKRDQLIIAGGSHWNGLVNEPAADTRIVSLSGVPTWRDPLPYSALPTYVGSQAALFVDPILDRVMLIGGAGFAPLEDFGDHIQMVAGSLERFTGWTDLDPSQIDPLIGAGVGFFDAPRDRALFWNGTLWEVTWDFGTPAALGDATTTADMSGVHLHWPGPVTQPYSASIDRSSDGGTTWAHLTSVSPLANGSLDVTDSTPPRGGHVAYRAVIERRGELRVIGTATLGGSPTPLTEPPLAFAIAPVRPNPAQDNVTLELASPSDTDVTVEVFDTAGRRVGAALHRRLSAGRVAFTVPLAHALRPGLYLVRARDGSRSVSAKLVVAR